MAQFSDLDQDVVGRILTSLPTFSALSAAIRASRGVYSVFAAHPKSTVLRVACNVVGHRDVLPPALRLVRCALRQGSDRGGGVGIRFGPPPDIGPEETVDTDVPLTQAETRLLERYGAVAHGLEALFSWRHKDRTSPASRLTGEESRRFRCAIYRFWLYCDLYRAAEWIEDLLGDAVDARGQLSERRETYLCAFSADELVDVARGALFVAETLAWTKLACRSGPAAEHPFDHYKDISSMGPQVVYDGYKQLYSTSPLMWNAGFFWQTCRAAFDRMCPNTGPGDDLEARLPGAILDDVVGGEDACNRCKNVHGNELWGASNWYLLQGVVNLPALCTFLPADLLDHGLECSLFVKRDTEGRFIQTHLDYNKLMDELMAIEDDQQDVWRQDGWYCLDCVHDLLRSRLWRWCLANKPGLARRHPGCIPCTIS